MINLAVKGFPNAIIDSEGKPFYLRTDFRFWLRFNLERINEAFLNAIPALTEEVIGQVFVFWQSPIATPTGGNSGGARPHDYELDGDYIYAAFLQQYGIDLIETEHMHWHKFIALFRGLTESTRFIQIVGYRTYDGKDKTYIRLRSQWALPELDEAETTEQKEAFDRYFDGEA